MVRSNRPPMPREIEYREGDVLSRVPECRTVIAFLTNDRSSTWGGGIARKIAVESPEVQRIFRRMVSDRPETLMLGNCVLIESTSGQMYAVLIAQKGYGRSAVSRIRYAALERALRVLASLASRHSAVVYMPAIGTGAARGRWTRIAQTIERVLCRATRVTVFLLPRRRRSACTTQRR